MNGGYFSNGIANVKKLEEYGFKREGEALVARFAMLGGQFELKVEISPDGKVETEVVDLSVGEIYALHLVDSATGEFVGKVREEWAARLADIERHCFDKALWGGGQASDILAYAKQKYGDELEFLWEKFPKDAVLRRKDTKKWYAAFIRLPFEKLGIRKEGEVDIIDLRMPKELPANVKNLVLPAYHMNKRTWFTVLLDGGFPLDALCALVDESYLLAE